jgi:hypothetical protein
VLFEPDPAIPTPSISQRNGAMRSFSSRHLSSGYLAACYHSAHFGSVRTIGQDFAYSLLTRENPKVRFLLLTR